MEDLKQLREAIDTIDGKLLGLLNDRARLAQEIGRIKKRNGKPVYAPERAEQLMRRLAEQSTGPLDAPAIRAIYIEIMSASLALEKEMVVACEGSVGGRTHFAAKQQFGSSVCYAFHPDEAGLFEAVKSGAADCGVISAGDDGPEGAVLQALEERGLFVTAQIIPGGEEKGGGSGRGLVLGTSLNTPSGHDQTALLIPCVHSVPPGMAVSALKATGIEVLSLHSPDDARKRISLVVEVAGHAAAPSLKVALDSLKASGIAAKICGSYPRLS